MDYLELIKFLGPHGVWILAIVYLFNENNKTRDHCREDIKEVTDKYENVMSELNKTLAILVDRTERD